MTVAVGEVAYSLGALPCSGVGLVWGTEDLDHAMCGPVSTLLFDDEGMANISVILTELADTEFGQDGVKRILTSRQDIQDWQVGEAIAEVYLTDHRSCHFPGPLGVTSAKEARVCRGPI